MPSPKLNLNIQHIHPPEWRGCYCIWQSNYSVHPNICWWVQHQWKSRSSGNTIFNKTPQKSLQYYLSLEDHHTVYEAELVGPILAAALLQQLDFPEDTSITINNQVAIKATTNCYSTLGQQFIKFFFNQMSELAKRHQGVPFKIHWIPGHKVISGNEADN